MTLDYKILWFEDNQTSFTTKKRQIKSVVEKLGFLFEEPRNEIDGENIENIDFSIYDLIIADLNLANDTKGSAILEKIRTMGIFTEVVFYSSEGEDYVRRELANYQIDGAYCADRSNEEFIEKVSKVILTTIKKVQDLNNMRGLIMSETSDIDKMMSQIVRISIEANSFGIKDSLISHIFTRIESKVKEKQDKFDKAKAVVNIQKVINDPLLFDASEKISAVQFVIESIDHEMTSAHKEDKFRKSYSSISKKRNLLGHETPRVIDGKTIIGENEHSFEFNDEFCADIRIQVKSHSDILQNILNLISES